MNPVAGAFQKQSKVFIPFLTAAYPDDKRFVDLMVLLAESGAGVIEVGIPFSDPVADGPTIQASSQKVLDRGVKMPQILKLMDKVRKKTDVPVVFMTYYNLLLRRGLKQAVKDIQAAGVNGLIVPDLIPEEGDDLLAVLPQEMSMTFLACQTTQGQRLAQVAQKSSGFVYYVSRLGVTGTGGGGLNLESVRGHIEDLRMLTQKPLAVGFGVSKAREAKQIYQFADGLIVGSALINWIDSLQDQPDFYKQLTLKLKGLLPA